MPEQSPEHLDPDRDLTARTFVALSHPIRIFALEALTKERRSASKLARSLRMSASQVSYHLSEVLEKRCDLITVAARYRIRGAEEKVYELKPEASLALLLLRVSSPVEPDTPSVRSSIRVDKQGQLQVHAAMRELAEQVRAVKSRCAALDPGELHQMIVGAAAFEIESAAAKEVA